jgi:nuclear pore complex protein Nup85
VFVLFFFSFPKTKTPKTLKHTPHSKMSPDAVGNGALIPFSGDTNESLAVYPLHHGLARPISRLALSWSRGNSLRVSLFAEPSGSSDAGDGAKVIEVKLGGGDPEIDDADWRRIAYGSVAPFALLQSRRNSLSALSKSPYHLDW